MSDNFDVIWRRGDGEMPKKAKYVVNAAREEKLFRSLQLSDEDENTIRYNATKSNKTVSEYIASLITTNLHPV